MKNKNDYYRALKEDNGHLNETDLGETLGFEEAKTRQIIVQLLSEYKIEYIENGACNYSIMQKSKCEINEKSNSRFYPKRKMRPE